MKKGACLAGTDSKVFAAKGGGTNEFWVFDPAQAAGFRPGPNQSSGSGHEATIASYPWTQLADVPSGTGPKPTTIKEGSGLVEDGARSLYLLKGSGTFEFYRYFEAGDSWHRLGDAPGGKSTKPFKNGSALTFDPDNNRIYCVKGSYNEFSAYDVGGQRGRTGLAAVIWPVSSADRRRPRSKTAPD